MKKHVLAASTAYLSWVLLFTVSVQAQQTERLNIDCGATSSYVDKDGLHYATDDKYIESGMIFNISSASIDESVKKRYWNLRSFPTDKRNCYRMESIKGKKYLIRAEFYYGNYDHLNQPPQFDLYVGTDFWKTINLTSSDVEYYTELITNATSDLIHICLINTDKGIPFISAIRLINLPQKFYQNFTASWSLILYKRTNAGSKSEVRYPNDFYDRIWDGWSIYDTINITSDLVSRNEFEIPSKVLQTASVPKDNGDSLAWEWTEISSSDQYHIALHFVELEKLGRNESREFDIYLGGDLFYGTENPEYLYPNTIYTLHPKDGKRFSMSLNKTSRSTHPPLINGMEVFVAKKLIDSTTDRQDVDAIMGIKTAYQVKKNWMGDPCLPKDFPWSGLTCNNNDPPRITALNLSSSGLVGNISHYLADISSTEYIDLSNNKLTGTIPGFLAQLKSLKILNLSNNKLSGSIPNSLKERIKNGLEISTDNNPDLVINTVDENHSKMKSPLLAIIISISIAAFILLAVWMILFYKRKKRHNSLSIHDTNMPHPELRKPEKETKKFRYAEVSRMTNNFENVIGKGGFGTVFSGYLQDGTRVAVKVLFESSTQGFREFSTEINLLTRIHHKNLVSFVGYCHEDSKMILIYEYMEGGNLRNMLSSDSNGNPNALSWKQRVGIALDAAQGLEYLHNGCKPPIIHRDVKTANILLNEKLEAKIADFGLSKTYSVDGITHISTVVKGTPGYLDPEYHTLSHLTEKSDVYSFGIVLLELLTGDGPIEKSSENIHIVQRVNSIIQGGEIRGAIDPRLKGECNRNSAWKFAELALLCTSPYSVHRPSMSQVIMELKECLTEERHKYPEISMNQRQPYKLSTENLDSEPSAR